MKSVQVLFLAMGESTKLQPITNTIPAPLLPIANRPLMLYPLELLARQNYKEFFVALHNQAGQIESYFGNGERWGVKLHYLLQRKALGNGGAARQTAAALQDNLLLVVPCDTIIDFDVSQLVAFHQERRAVVTVLVQAEGSSGDCLVSVDNESHVSLSSEDKAVLRYDTGLYLFSPQAINMIPAGQYCDIHNHLLPLLLAKEMPIYAYESAGYWNSLSSFSAYHAAQTLLLNKEDSGVSIQPSLKSYWHQGQEVANGIWIGRNNVIHPTAQLQPPIVIGNNCHIGQGAQLGPDTVIGDNVIIDEEATLAHTTVLDGTYVGQLIRLESRLVNKNQVVDVPSGEAVSVTDEFLVGQTFQSVSDTGLFQFLEKCVALLVLLSLSWLMGLISLLLWLTVRRVITKETYYYGIIESSSQNSAFKVEPLFLWQFVTKDDNGRQTALGRWLQRWDLYRLPHLWHVISGELALVGVKLLTEEETTYIKEEWQQKRFEQMPGFTGLWYVQPQQLDGIDSIFIADTYYAVAHSWHLDVKIIGQTLPAWWRKSRQR